MNILREPMSGILHFKNRQQLSNFLGQDFEWGEAVKVAFRLWVKKSKQLGLNLNSHQWRSACRNPLPFAFGKSSAPSRTVIDRSQLSAGKREFDAIGQRIEFRT